MQTPRSGTRDSTGCGGPSRAARDTAANRRAKAWSVSFGHGPLEIVLRQGCPRGKVFERGTRPREARSLLARCHRARGARSRSMLSLALLRARTGVRQGGRSWLRRPIEGSNLSLKGTRTCCPCCPSRSRRTHARGCRSGRTTATGADNSDELSRTARASSNHAG